MATVTSTPKTELSTLPLSPRIQQLAQQLTKGFFSTHEKLDALIDYVRDEIPFGFPPKWEQRDPVEVLDSGVGYCISKSILFQALCQASGIPARIHFGMIKIDIMHGIIPNWAFDLAPATGIHAWVDVLVDDKWHSIDTFINDQKLYRNIRRKLIHSRRSIGFSLACIPEAPCSLHWREGYHHMGAVTEYHGVWASAEEYFASRYYQPLPRWVSWSYPILRLFSNRNIRRLRRGE